jgi:hypothetical protein
LSQSSQDYGASDKYFFCHFESSAVLRVEPDLDEDLEEDLTIDLDKACSDANFVSLCLKEEVRLGVR